MTKDQITFCRRAVVDNPEGPVSVYGFFIATGDGMLLTVKPSNHFFTVSSAADAKAAEYFQVDDDGRVTSIDSAKCESEKPISKMTGAEMTLVKYFAKSVIEGESESGEINEVEIYRFEDLDQNTWLLDIHLGRREVRVFPEAPDSEAGEQTFKLQDDGHWNYLSKDDALRGSICNISPIAWFDLFIFAESILDREK